MKKTFIVFLFLSNLIIPLTHAKTKAENFIYAGKEEYFIEISGLLEKHQKKFTIISKAETQSRTSYEIDKKASNKAAFRRLKKMTGRQVRAEIRILSSNSPFSHTVALLSIE